MRCLPACSALLLVAVSAAAQELPTDPQTELLRAERARTQSQADAAHLLDLRLRHDLGIGSASDEVDSLYRAEAPVGSEQMARMQQEFNDTAAQRDRLMLEYDKLHKAVEQLLADAEARARQNEERPYVVVPVAGSAQARRELPPTATTGGTAGTPPPAPAGESAPLRRPADPLGPALAVDPLRAQIHGSLDHARVAQSLFKVGREKIEIAATLRAQGRADLAKEFDDRGRDHLLRALDELAPVVKDKQAPLEAMFCLGRCRELLFRYSERHEGLSLLASARDYQRREQEVRDAFLAITIRDIKKGAAAGGADALGTWGQAAQAAMDHFRWINLHGNYDATARIEALTWPGEKRP